jgi:deazaflavin-dependent oxidoreductase (nitroreductase family)
MAQQSEHVAEKPRKSPYLPPRWFIRSAWILHRALLRFTGGRRGLWTPSDARWGTMLLTTVGGSPAGRGEAILGYYEDGPNLVTLAMNGWGAPEPAWWLNLQARPEATVRTKNGTIAVHGRAAVGEERARLWARWQGLGDNVDGYSVRRPGQTAVVVLEPTLVDSRG